MPRMRHVHTDLMGAPSFQPTFNLCQCFRRSITLYDPHTRYGVPSSFEQHGLTLAVGFVPRKMLPLSLSYDHRVINGADGGGFLTELVQNLADIRRMLL